MDDNPYRAPLNVELGSKPNRLVVVGLCILALVVAADLIIGGVIKTFVWGIGLNAPWQIAYGVFSLAAGALILERLVRHLRMLYHPKQKLGSGNIVVVVLIWAVILVGVVMDVWSLIRAFS